MKAGAPSSWRIIIAFTILSHVSSSTLAKPVGPGSSSGNHHDYATTSHNHSEVEEPHVDPFHEYTEDYGIMNVRKVGPKWEWTYEVEAPRNLAIHKIDPVHDNPDNLQHVLRALFHINPARYAAKAKDRIRSAAALEWMNDGCFVDNLLHNSRQRRQHDAVHLPYASTPEVDVIAYSKVEQNRRDRHFQAWQERRNRGEEEQGVKNGDANDLGEYERKYRERMYKTHYVDKQRVPYWNNKRHRESSKIDNLDLDLKRKLLDDEANQFSKIFSHHLNGELNRLEYHPRKGFRLDPSLREVRENWPLDPKQQ